MRGKRCGRDRSLGMSRIIPAHAGQTQKRFVAAVDQADHPRACGANVRYGVTSAAASGSSPRMRGKHRRSPPAPTTAGIIPAHAGQTYVAAGDRGEQADHPRACGANGYGVVEHAPPIGSSPRMRGKRRASSAPTPRGRIIPAHAGQTSGKNRRTPRHPDHPRACGAN